MVYATSAEYRNQNLRDAEPQVRCAVMDCEERAWEDEWPKCEACEQRVCPEHRRTFKDVMFCEQCARCNDCPAPAAKLCGECGELQCGAHPCGYCATRPDPGDLPAEAYDANDATEALAGWR